MASSRQEAELKQQGAIEAARDPNTTVSADDAEQAVLREARKDGGAAMAFDPDATPAEKAAQARSVSAPPPGLLKLPIVCPYGRPTRAPARHAWSGNVDPFSTDSLARHSIFRQGFTTTINPRPQRSSAMS